MREGIFGGSSTKMVVMIEPRMITTALKNLAWKYRHETLKVT